VDARVWTRDLPKTMLPCYEQKFELNDSGDWYYVQENWICIVPNKETQIARDCD